MGGKYRQSYDLSLFYRSRQLRSPGDGGNGQILLLERTPVPVTLFIFIACSVYLIIGGMSDLGRLFPFYLTITIIILLVVFSFSFKIFDLDNLRPVLGQGFLPLWLP